MERSAGIILPITALGSPHGIGTLGQAARDFVDFLEAARQSWWQVLPVGPTTTGDSPYQSPSAFAGNPALIDLDALVADGLLLADEVQGVAWGDDPACVDYDAVLEGRLPLLRLATERGWERDEDAVRAFVAANDDWLPDYALFAALGRHFGTECWWEWPDVGARLHRKEALERLGAKLADDVRLFTYMQYLFFTQWAALRDYARAHGVKIFGDMAIYVALASADVWAHPENYRLDEDLVPTVVAGVPPDYFSAEGQLWGNPIYDWDAMAEDGFAWWRRRVRHAGRLFDMVRIDHFRGIARYWAVPADAATARGGHWEWGPGMALISAIREGAPDVALVAEDLGTPTPEVAELLSASGLPGMKVLQFAFDGREDNEHLPHDMPVGCLCYTGTHDNATLAEWLAEADPRELDLARRYMGLNAGEGPVWGVVRQGMSSVAMLFMAQMQDYLELGAEARTNTPGTMGGNWRWRLVDGQLTQTLAGRVADLTRLYGRARNR